MPLLIGIWLVLFVAQAFAYDNPTVFKTDVAMARIDAQVLDRDGRAITGLRREDFVLRVDGRVVPIRNFASENMPLDVLLLLDVSGSMRPHVERIASAAREALNELADNDRMAVMVFDTYTRLRLPFREDHEEIVQALNRVIRSEGFNGGTHITYALLNAARYVEQNARPNARRAIVILTDDETQDQEDEPRVEAALARANAVLSFLQAPYEEPRMGRGRPRGTWGSGGGWPGVGFPGNGPIIFGPRRPGGYGGYDPSHSAGTAQIARDSGGDTIPVSEASALEETLARLRQRYSLFFYLPEGTTTADQRSVEVDLSDQARLRFEEAEVRYRRVYMAGSSNEAAGPVMSRVQEPVTIPDSSSHTTGIQQEENSGPQHHRIAVNEDSGPVINAIPDDNDRQAVQAQPSAQTGQQPGQPAAAQAPKGGWPRVSPQSDQN